jgi:hypothetical protein
MVWCLAAWLIIISPTTTDLAGEPAKRRRVMETWSHLPAMLQPTVRAPDGVAVCSVLQTEKTCSQQGELDRLVSSRR